LANHAKAGFFAVKKLPAHGGARGLYFLFRAFEIFLKEPLIKSFVSHMPCADGFSNAKKTRLGMVCQGG